MLELEKLLWVIPSLLFIHIYNKQRPQGSLKLTGQQYVFALVFISAFCWLPFSFFFHKGCDENFYCLYSKLFISLFFSGIFALIFSSKYISKKTFLPVYDIFFLNCVKWEKTNEPVILTLKNDKAYIGYLTKYTENPRSKFQ